MKKNKPTLLFIILILLISIFRLTTGYTENDQKLDPSRIPVLIDKLNKSDNIFEQTEIIRKFEIYQSTQTIDALKKFVYRYSMEEGGYKRGIDQLCVRALWILFKIRSPIQVIEFINDISKEKNVSDSINSVIIGKLEKINDSRVIEPLINYLNNEKFEIRFSAAQSLSKKNDSRGIDVLIDYLKNKEHVVRFRAAHVLSEINDLRVIDALVNSLEEDDMSRVVAYALYYNNNPRIKVSLLNALKSDKVKMRKATVETLGWFDDSWIVEPLINALNDSEVEVCVEAIKSLDKIKYLYPQAKKALTRCLDDKNEAIRSAASVVLKNFSDQQEKEFLLDALSNQKVSVRKTAVEVLGAIEKPWVVEPLISASNDSVVEVCVDAIKSLGKIKNKYPKAKEALIACLNNSTEAIRLAANDALK